MKRFGLFLLIMVIVVIPVVTFTALNTGSVEVDLAFRKITASVPAAFSITFVLGWLFGVISMGLFAFRLVRECRSLRRSLRVSESEVSSLRNLPLSDAD